MVLDILRKTKTSTSTKYVGGVSEKRENSLHWLSVAAGIRLKTLMLIQKAKTQSTSTTTLPSSLENGTTHPTIPQGTHASTFFSFLASRRCNEPWLCKQLNHWLSSYKEQKPSLSTSTLISTCLISFKKIHWLMWFSFFLY